MTHQAPRLILILTLLMAMTAGAAHAQRTIRVVYDDGRPPEDVSTWQLPDGGAEWFIRANDVARLFKATLFWNSSSRKVVLGVGTSRFILTVDTRVVVVDGEPVMMRTPSLYDGGFVMVPLEFILDIASHYTPRTFSWDERRMELHVEGLGYNVHKLSIASAANRTTATIDLDEPLLYHMDTGTRGLVRLKLYGGRVDTRSFDVRQPRGLIEGVRAEQTDRDAFLVFDVNPETRRLRIDRNENPHQLILVLEKGELPEIPDTEYEGREVVEIIDDTARERRSFEINTVVLDAGHGGLDDGKIGVNGLIEKNVNLTLVRVIGKRLEEDLGVKVVYTREDDTLLSLTERTEKANTAGGDLLISVHCNSWFSETPGGFEAYFLSPALSESDRALARFENASGGDKVSPNGDIEFIVWDMVQNEFINESSAFAEYIQKAMEEHLSLRNRGVKQANFMVLQGAKMPAVLIETAFLSNPQEAALLDDPAFHDRVAQGVVDAVRAMKERYR